MKGRLGVLICTKVVLCVFCVSAYASAFECLIEPSKTVVLSSPTTGLLDRVSVTRGDRVKKGQVLAMLDSQVEQSAVNSARFKSEQLGPMRLAENKILFLTRKFERQRNLAVDKLVSVQERDNAESELRLAEAELLVAKENRQIAKLELLQQLSLLSIRSMRSPFDGVVVEQLAFPGEMVEPGVGKKSILKIAQLNPVKVHVILPKKLFGKIKIGKNVEVLPEIPNKVSYTAEIKTIDKLIDAGSGTFVVYLEIKNPQFSIPIGVKCNAIFNGV